MTIMETLAEIKTKPITELAPDEMAVLIANEAIDGLYNAILAHFGSIEKAAKHLGLEPANVNRTIGKNRTRRMSAWLFASLCNATGFQFLSASSVDVLKTQQNVTLEGFLMIRRMAGELSDAVEIMGRQG